MFYKSFNNKHREWRSTVEFQTEAVSWLIRYENSSVSTHLSDTSQQFRGWTVLTDAHICVRWRDWPLCSHPLIRAQRAVERAGHTDMNRLEVREVRVKALLLAPTESIKSVPFNCWMSCSLHVELWSSWGAACVHVRMKALELMSNDVIIISR